MYIKVEKVLILYTHIFKYSPFVCVCGGGARIQSRITHWIYNLYLESFNLEQFLQLNFCFSWCWHIWRRVHAGCLASYNLNMSGFLMIRFSWTFLARLIPRWCCGCCVLPTALLDWVTWCVCPISGLDKYNYLVNVMSVRPPHCEGTFLF